MNERKSAMIPIQSSDSQLTAIFGIISAMLEGSIVFSVRTSVGYSFLMRIGEKKLDIGNNEEIHDWYLHIYDCEWEVRAGGKIVAKWDEDSDLNELSQFIDGSRIENFSLSEKEISINIGKEYVFKIRTESYEAEYDHANGDHPLYVLDYKHKWQLRYENKVGVIVRII